MENKALIDKLNELQWASRKPQEEYLQEGDGPLDDYMRKREVLDQHFEDLKHLAREEGTVVGRRVSFQTMDSHAHYVVTHSLKSGKVVVLWINYDADYIDDRLGERGILPLEFVQSRIDWEDQLDRFPPTKMTF